MRVRILIIWSAAAALFSFTPPAVSGPAAQEIPQCYVGTQPCGTPEHLYQRILECLQDPLFCSNATDGHDVVAGTHSINYSALPSASGDGVAASSTKRPLRKGITELTRLEPKPSVANSRTADVNDQKGQKPVAIEESLEFLLDQAVLSLHDVMPPDPGSVERRLGLRRTRAEGIDLRGKTPSTAEIVEALAPIKRSGQ